MISGRIVKRDRCCSSISLRRNLYVRSISTPPDELVTEANSRSSVARQNRHYDVSFQDDEDAKMATRRLAPEIFDDRGFLHFEGIKQHQQILYAPRHEDRLVSTLMSSEMLPQPFLNFTALPRYTAQPSLSVLLPHARPLALDRQALRRRLRIVGVRSSTSLGQNCTPASLAELRRD
jgi:hypothetical protein